MRKYIMIYNQEPVLTKMYTYIHKFILFLLLDQRLWTEMVVDKIGAIESAY